MNKKVILVHGYFRNHIDMIDLKKNLETLGYQGILIDLPLTFKDIEYASNIFEEKMKEIISSLKENEKISLVGHSTGGLIIRLFLSKKEHTEKINRCVLIATPNKGSRLADLASKIRPFVKVFKTLNSLTGEKVGKLKFNHQDSLEIGIIAGNRCNMLLGKLLNYESDGRVEVDSARDVAAKDFIVVPYNHKEIHHKYDIAHLVYTFLQKGNFRA